MAPQDSENCGRNFAKRKQSDAEFAGNSLGKWRMVIIDTVIHTLLGGLTLDPAGMHCPSWDDAFVSSWFWKYCELEIWQRSLKVITTGTFQQIGYGFLSAFYRNIVPKTHLRKFCDLEAGLGGHWRSLKMTLFDTSPMTLLMCSVSCLSEIFSVDTYHDREIPVKGQWRSLKVVPFDRLDMVSY